MSSPSAAVPPPPTADPGAVSVRLLLFAKAREAAGGSSAVRLALPAGTTAAAARPAIVAALPALAELLPYCALAVNAEYADEVGGAPLVAGDELAVIPPISGG